MQKSYVFRKWLILSKHSFLQLLLLTCLIGNVNALDGVAQEILKTRISLNMRNMQIENVLNEIQTKAKVRFAFSSKFVQNVQPITITADNQTLDKVLDDLLQPLNLKYRVSKSLIIISRDEKAKSQGNIERVPEINNADRLLASEILIKGRVNDEKGISLPGVSIVIKGTTKGTTTDASGRFELNVAQAGAILTFSFVGYTTFETAVTTESEMNIRLDPDLGLLNEVLVVGYGTQKKVNSTGAVDMIKGDALVNRPTPTVSQALQGKVSGVNFSTGSFGFEPGAGLGIQIRGQGTPLVLIDNVVGSLNGINPNDIESVSILKDAAASAIYGARAPYGVVLITTKSGSNTGKLNIEFSTSTSLITAPGRFIYNGTGAQRSCCEYRGGGSFYQRNRRPHYRLSEKPGWYA
jgi:TonB-dependent SusC/RagA subfamily outer membrane receptor